MKSPSWKNPMLEKPMMEHPILGTSHFAILNSNLVINQGTDCFRMRGSAWADGRQDGEARRDRERDRGKDTKTEKERRGARDRDAETEMARQRRRTIDAKTVTDITQLSASMSLRIQHWHSGSLRFTLTRLKCTRRPRYCMRCSAFFAQRLVSLPMEGPPCAVAHTTVWERLRLETPSIPSHMNAGRRVG